jgi:hypothetical protein
VQNIIEAAIIAVGMGLRLVPWRQLFDTSTRNQREAHP